MLRDGRPWSLRQETTEQCGIIFDDATADAETDPAEKSVRANDRGDGGSIG